MICKARKLSAPYFYVLYDKKIENLLSSKIWAFRKNKYCSDDLMTSLIFSLSEGRVGGSTIKIRLGKERLHVPPPQLILKTKDIMCNYPMPQYVFRGTALIQNTISNPLLPLPLRIDRK